MDQGFDLLSFRLVVLILGLVVLTTVFGGLALAYVDHAGKLPDVIISLGSASVGALVGLLVPSPVVPGKPTIPTITTETVSKQ